MRNVDKGGLAAVALLALAACTQVWAGSIAKNVATGLASIKSYAGVTTETGIDAQPVERSVLYSRPGKLRVETRSAGPHQGELFLYDGETVTLWYPQHLFGMRIRGARLPTEREVFHHIERLTRTSLDAYTFALESEGTRIAGNRALAWLVRPARRAPYRFVHRVWNHDPSTMPIKMELWREDKSLWYGFQFKQLAFDLPVPPSAFEHTFPKNAVVIEWDLDGPALTIEQAREEMNFKVQLPTRLPRGHAVTKIVQAQHCLPSLVVAMDHDGTMLSLVETRDSGLAAPPLGVDVMLAGNVPAKLSFMGAISVVSWVKDGTLLTLTGNLDFPTMLDVAGSVQ
jgi:outer membrane lipoprotein-sorting protein